MKSDQLLRERAERGTARGPASVWAAADRAAGQPAETDRGQSARWFRVAVVCACTALVFAVAVARSIGPNEPTQAGLQESAAVQESSDPATDAVTDPSDDPIEPDLRGSPDFAKLLIDGMTLTDVQRPFDEDDAGGEDFLDRLFGPGEEVTPATIDSDPTATQIFAEPDDPFNGPIVAIENLAGGGFRPVGANLGDRSIEFYSNQLQRQDGEWSIDPASGLVEVDRAEGHPFDGLKFGWQFDFENGSEVATLLVEPSGGRGVYVWLARILRSEQNGLTTRGTVVLDAPAVAVATPSDGPDSGQVYWADEHYVYRLTTATADGHDRTAGHGLGLVPRLLVVGDSTWELAVAEADSPSFGPVGKVQANLLLVALWLVSAALFWSWSRWAAVLGPMAAIFGFVTAPNSWSTAALSALALTGFWLVYRRAKLRTSARAGQPRYSRSNPTETSSS